MEGNGRGIEKVLGFMFFLSVGLQGYAVLVAGSSAGLWLIVFKTATRSG